MEKIQEETMQEIRKIMIKLAEEKEQKDKEHQERQEKANSMIKDLESGLKQVEAANERDKEVQEERERLSDHLRIQLEECGRLAEQMKRKMDFFSLWRWKRTALLFASSALIAALSTVACVHFLFRSHPPKRTIYIQSHTGNILSEKGIFLFDSDGRIIGRTQKEEKT